VFYGLLSARSRWSLGTGWWFLEAADCIQNTVSPLRDVGCIGISRAGETILKEIVMAGEKKTVAETKGKRVEVAQDPKQKAEAEMDDLKSYEPASARNIPRPLNTLASPPKGKIGKLNLSLLGDLTAAPSLAEIEKLNKEPLSQGRTPLITVIQAVLAKAGGTMNLEDLTVQTLKHWNRPLPASPYTPDQFIYVMARNSDNIRIKE
jgi:hypothetical protein